MSGALQKAESYPLVVYWDTETTSLDTENGSIVELCGMISPDWLQLHTPELWANKRYADDYVFSRLIRPTGSNRIPNSEIHGITDQMVETADSFQVVFQAYEKWLKQWMNRTNNTRILHAAHNGIRFDQRILQTELTRATLRMPSWLHPTDTMIAIADGYGIRPGHLRLIRLAERFIGKPIDQNHRAFGDTLLLARVVQNLPEPQLFYDALLGQTSHSINQMT